MADQSDQFDINIRTTADTSGAQITQNELEQTAQAGEKIVDAVTKGDRATANFVAKLKQLTPEQIARVETEMRQLVAAEEAAGRNASALREQLQRVASVNVEKQATAISGLFGTVTGANLAAQGIARVTQAVQDHLRQSVELADQLDDLAGRAGVAASELQRIGNVAQQNNGSIQGTADALSKVQISAQGALEGSKPLVENFTRLGISLDELRSLTPEQMFYRIADAVSTSNDRGRTYADVVDVMGRSSKDLFTTLELGSEEIKKLGGAIGVFSDQTIKDLAKAKDSIQAFQNQLTILAGQSIAAIAAGTHLGREAYASFFGYLTDAFYGATTDTEKFTHVQARLAEGAAKAKKPIDDEADALGKLGDGADKAADAIDKINQKARDNAIAKLPLVDQMKELEIELNKVQGQLGAALPGGALADLPGLLAAATRIGGTAGLTIAQLAEKYGALQERIAKLKTEQSKATDAAIKGTADQIAIEGDLITQLRVLTAESAKPNLSVQDRLKLLEQELVLLQKIKQSEDQRIAAANAAVPAAAARVKDINDQLRNMPVTGLPADADTRGALQHERDDLVKQTGVGVTGTATALDATIKQTNDAIDKLKGTVDSEGGKIPPGLEGVNSALDAALKGFSDGLTKTTSAVTQGVPPVVEAVTTLDTTLASGLAGVGKSIGGLAANTNTRLSALQGQIDALWRAI